MAALMADEKFIKPVTYEDLAQGLADISGLPLEDAEEFICTEVEPTTLDEERGSFEGIMRIIARFNDVINN